MGSENRDIVEPLMTEYPTEMARDPGAVVSTGKMRWMRNLTVLVVALGQHH